MIYNVLTLHIWCIFRCIFLEWCRVFFRKSQKNAKNTCTVDVLYTVYTVFYAVFYALINYKNIAREKIQKSPLSEINNIYNQKTMKQIWNEWKDTIYLSILFIIIGLLIISFSEDIPSLMVLLMGSPLIALGVWSFVNWVVIILSFYLEDK